MSGKDGGVTLMEVTETRGYRSWSSGGRSIVECACPFFFTDAMDNKVSIAGGVDSDEWRDAAPVVNAVVNSSWTVLEPVKHNGRAPLMPTHVTSLILSPPQLTLPLPPSPSH
jgi:hypothetical protein